MKEFKTLLDIKKYLLSINTVPDTSNSEGYRTIFLNKLLEIKKYLEEKINNIDDNIEEYYENDEDEEDDEECIIDEYINLYDMVNKYIKEVIIKS